MGNRGVPLRAVEAGVQPIADWWGRTGPTSKGLVLRSDFVRPNPALRPGAPWEHERTGMKDLLRHRGVGAHLFLCALYLEQLRHPAGSGPWLAEPIDQSYHVWRDQLTARGELLRPSWASLVLGFEERPRDPARSRKWHTTRYRAVTAGFQRLADTQLFNATDSVLQSEDRRWRWNRQVVEKTYRSVDARDEDSFIVPRSVFTTGLYLRLSGPGLYALLVAFQHRKGSRPFHLRGLTWKTFDLGYEDVRSNTRDPEILKKLGALRKLRFLEEGVSIVRRAGDPRAKQPSPERVAAVRRELQ